MAVDLTNADPFDENSAQSQLGYTCTHKEAHHWSLTNQLNQRSSAAGYRLCRLSACCSWLLQELQPREGPERPIPGLKTWTSGLRLTTQATQIPTTCWSVVNQNEFSTGGLWAVSWVVTVGQVALHQDGGHDICCAATGGSDISACLRIPQKIMFPQFHLLNETCTRRAYMMCTHEMNFRASLTVWLWIDPDVIQFSIMD